MTGLGAASADACYGFIAAFGLTFISSFLITQRVFFSLIGGFFLLYLGVKTFMAAPADQAAPVKSQHGLLGAYASTFFLTLTNPVTILSFAAIFAGAGIATTVTAYDSAAVMVGGVFLGSSAWWLLLSGGVSLLRGRITPRLLHWINRFSGAILVIFGFLALISAA